MYFYSKVWDSFVFIVLSIAAVLFSIIFIDVKFAAVYQAYYYWTVIIVFAIDFYFTFKLSPKKISDIFEINSNNSKLLFITDFIATFPWVLLVNTEFIWLIPLFKYFRIISKLRILYLKSVKNSTLLRIAFFIYGLMLSAHWITLGWISLNNNSDSSFLSEYLTSLYWSITTLTTVGYGDIVPKNDAQILYSIFVMIFGIGMYGYLIGNIASILSTKNPVRQKYLENMDRLKTLVSYRKIPIELQNKIRDFYLYLFSKKSGYDENSLLLGLPDDLKNEISLYLKKDLLDSVSFFKNAPENFLQEIITYLKPLFCVPLTKVMEEGEIGEEMFFIAQGELDVFSNSKKISTLKSGDFVGEIALFKNIPRTATIISKSFSNLYLLKKQDYEKIIRKYPKFAEEIEKKVLQRSL